AGATTVHAVNGVATFNLSLTTAGNSYTLFFTAGNVTGITSQTFAITALAAVALGLGQQPVNTVVGQAINPAVTVQLLDRYGNVASGASSTIAFGLGSNPTGATLGGTTTAATVNGVATFSNLTVNRAGS